MTSTPILHRSIPPAFSTPALQFFNPPVFLFFLLALVFFRGTGILDATAAQGSRTLTLTRIGEDSLAMTWGGHFKVRATLSRPDEGSLYDAAKAGTYEDGGAEARLKSTLFLGKKAYLEAHYETVYSAGDTLFAQSRLSDLLPPSFVDLFARGPLEDETRFMDLTKTIRSDDDSVWYHRLDRLYLTWLPEWGSFSIGRQTVTWGNGYVFNPMDLVNPFSPTDIERDYKIGTDMVSTLVNLGASGDLQVVYVPGRDPLNHELSWQQSILGGKGHFSKGATEFDVTAVADHGDAVLGLGSRGYLGGAAWRCDATWTFVDGSPRKNGYLSMVANIDYSWVAWGKNFYGVLEFYSNGLGDDDYAEALRDPALLERLARGQLYTLGRYYLSGHLSVEVHPLFNVYLTVISNLQDPSGVIQPRAVWSVSQNLDLTFGAHLYYGGKETEYGGIAVPGASYPYSPLLSAYAWLSYYF